MFRARGSPSCTRHGVKLRLSTTARTRRLVGKAAVITGGTSGIRKRTAWLFVAHDARVVVANIQDELGARLCAELGAPDVASYVHRDVTVEADVSAAVDHAVSRFVSLDVMFNNAGIGGAPCHSIRESDKADFERVQEVSPMALSWGTKHAARIMVPAGRDGCIIGTSSTSSAVVGGASHAYTLVGLTENAAAELGRHGIQVNCGEAFEQAMEAVANLKGVRLSVDDIANAVLFFTSDDARFISGHNLLIAAAVQIRTPYSTILKSIAAMTQKR
ncbi:hypothetical protein ACP70R_023029 [Stipagrostis hirtigluma subsp. patula]